MGGLSGMNEICKYCHRSEPTIMKWIQAQGFPAHKITGSWESDTELIDEWRKGIIQQVTNSNGNSGKKGRSKNLVKQKNPK